MLDFRKALPKPSKLKPHHTRDSSHLAQAGGVPFEDERLSKEEFGAQKGASSELSIACMVTSFVYLFIHTSTAITHHIVTCTTVTHLSVAAAGRFPNGQGMPHC